MPHTASSQSREWLRPGDDDLRLPCQQHHHDLWFADHPHDIEVAKALCGQCPVTTACLDGALDRRESCGVWGGQLMVNGVIVARKRPRGRPRKRSAA
nr:WhiB family transcriptional regulator [Ornithinimicrobium murale]